MNMVFESDKDREKRMKREDDFMENIPFHKLDELSTDEYKRLLDVTRNISTGRPNKEFVKKYAAIQKFWVDKSENFAVSWSVANLENPDELIYNDIGWTSKDRISNKNKKNEEEKEFLEETAQLMLKFPTIPCNDCKYCMPCPYGLDIPAILVHYNKCVNEGNVPKSSQDENYRRARRAFLIGYDRSVPKLRQASHCTGCNQCNPHCPQSIDIPKELHRIDAYVEQLKQETL